MEGLQFVVHPYDFRDTVHTLGSAATCIDFRELDQNFGCNMADLILSDILKNTPNGLHGSGFLFGAGTSVEAGYPMMGALTRTVVDALHPSERDALNQALEAHGEVYDATSATPNIEFMADRVISHGLDSNDSRFVDLESQLKYLVTEVILSVVNPKLDNHISFFNLLKARTYGRASCVYIFTTNYDILFELAAAQSGVAIETGFSGAVNRFLDLERFSTACGQLDRGRFALHPILTVRLLKLHGSISWIQDHSGVYERHPDAIARGQSRVMILPRRRKVFETLQYPYDKLFSISSRVIGSECKYMASCGFSFGDEHFNSLLITPGMNARRFSLFTLCQAATDGISAFRALPAFSAAFENGGIRSGVTHSTPSDLWKFSEFVKLFA